jgi:orotidine-5'-phosphate decarboxylase
MNLTPKDRLIFALDVSSPKEAAHYIELLEPHVGMFKVGLEAFISCGHSVFPLIQKPIMLDLKLHDIPQTVERSIRAAGKFGVKFLTIHMQQPQTLERAIVAAKETNIELLGVTLLSSMSAHDCAAVGYLQQEPTHRAETMVRYGLQKVLTGYVCAPTDVKRIRNINNYITLVVPGVRSDGEDKGDQQRIGTPAQTILDGADYIVVGRSIRDAKDPVLVANTIVSEIETGLKQRK